MVTHTPSDAWRQAVAEAQDKPWLLALLRRHGVRLYTRFLVQYRRLLAQPAHRTRRLQRRLGLSLAGAALLLALAVSPAMGVPDGTIVVDESTCTLVNAITTANTDTNTGGCTGGTAGADTIDLQANVTLTAVNNVTYGNNGLPVVISPITIAGNGRTISRAGGSPSFRILAVHSGGNLTLQSVTISGGVAPGVSGGGIYNRGTLTVSNSTLSGNSANGHGGGVFNRAGTLMILNSTLSGNSANSGGGGIYNVGALTVSNSTLFGNSASDRGGGIGSPGTLTVSNSNLSGNSAGRVGGGIYAYHASAAVTDSTIFGNSASLHGGGIYIRGYTLTVLNSTLFGNNAIARGGGISLIGVGTVSNSTLYGNSAKFGGGTYVYGALTVSNSTLSGNYASSGGGGILKSTGSVVVNSSIVALQTGGDDCNTALTSAGYNIESGTSCGFTGTGDQQSVTSGQLNLKPLANSGGPTNARALGYGSFALDRIPSGTNGCGTTVTTDQRGITRPQDWGADDTPDRCDVGAWEGQPNAPNAVTLASLQASAGGGLAPAGLAGLAAVLLGGLGLGAFGAQRRRCRPVRPTRQETSPPAALLDSPSGYTPPAISHRGQLKHFSGSPLSFGPPDPFDWPK